jgi:hypothetical protein
MISCPIPCLNEAIIRGGPSPGPIGDEERVCRAGKEPMHYKKNGKVNGSLIQNKELVAGRLSVWRIDAFDDFTLDSVVAEVQSKLPCGHLVKDIFAVKAKVVRAISVKEVHAAISLCAERKKRGIDKDHEGFQGIKERLLSELKKGRV